VNAGISLIQLREKNLPARMLHELTMRAVDIVRGSSTKLLVNDRADIAAATGADGVHLTSTSLSAATVRATFGNEFLIGVSSHTPAEARAARGEGADFAVFGPVFETVSKRIYGNPLGLSRLTEVTTELAPFPILALGGVTLENAAGCLRAGAAGIAGISLFSNVDQLKHVVQTVTSSGT